MPLSLTLPNWALWLFGLPSDAGANLSQSRLHFATGWAVWAAALLAAVAIAWFVTLYRRDGTRPSWLLKTPMLLCRLCALAALCLMLSQPTCRRQISNQVRSQVVILVDASQSMTFADPKLPSDRARKEAVAVGTDAEAVKRQTRLERANALLNKSGLMQRLAQKYDVRLYTFASDPISQPLPTDPKRLQEYRFQLTPDAKRGESTQMANALRRPLQDLEGQPLAGALLISDGGNNLGDDPILAADAARQGKLPISAVGLGDPTRTKDLALLSVLADDVARTNNTVSVYVSLAQRGYAGQRVSVVLQRGEEVIGRETVTLGKDDQKQDVRFVYAPTKPGRFTYTVSVAPLTGEVTAANNKRTFLQTVISKKLKVLYVEEEPRYEYRYLRNAILRDTSLEFACLLLTSAEVSEGNIPVREFPRDEKTLFDYDIIVLGDVPRSTFSESQLEMMKRFVEDRGGSLLVIAGEQHMPHEYASSPLEAVLPVVVSPSPDPILSEDPFSWQLTNEGKRSPILLMEDDPKRNAEVWANLPGMFWSAGVQRAKPGATVLAVHPQRRNADGPLPILAVQPFGEGKCYIQLVDSAWRWRWRVGDRHFYRYWGQVFRTLTPKELPNNSRLVQINADRSVYRLGERVILSARLKNANFKPLKAETATATLTDANGRVQPVILRAAPGSPGLFTTEFPPERTGRYNITLNSPINAQAKASAEFMVESLALERQKPELDETLLKKVAASGGGRYYAPDEVAQWANTLPDNPLVVSRELEYEMWSAPFFLLLFLLPLTLEWLLRKRTGLL